MAPILRLHAGPYSPAGAQDADLYTRLPESSPKLSRQAANTALREMESMRQNGDSRPPPKASSKPKPKPKPSNPRHPASRAQCLLTPRPYEEIYHERAYLATYLQQKTKRIESLIKEYSETEAQLNNGAEGKTRRRLRKLLHVLRAKLDEVSEQERAIFSRMGELYMELNSRDTWERSRMMHSSAQAQTAGEDCATAPVTPCPSFASSEWSVSSSSVLVSPVSISDPNFPDVQVRRCVDEHVMPRSLASEYLETVPEEGEDGIKQQLSAEEGQMREEDAPQWRPLNQEPEIGTLEYDYVQYENSGDEDDDDGAHGSGSEAAEAAPKPRINRFSLPVMQFSWPDA